MLERIAQSICKQASKIINYSVIITNQKGIIIGSSQEGRCGSFHEASLESVKYGRQLYHDSKAAARLSGTQPGVTMPITINNEVVGTVGITGTPDEVSKYGNLIKIFAEMLVRTELIKDSAILKNKDRLELLRELINFDGSAASGENFLSHCTMLGYDMSIPRAVIYLDYRNLEVPDARKLKQVSPVLSFDYHVMVKQQFCGAEDIRISVGEERYVVFAALKSAGGDYVDRLKKKFSELEEQMRQCGFCLTAGIGRKALTPEELKRSYEDAKLSWEVALERCPSSCLYIDDFNLEKLICRIPQTVLDNFANEQLGSLRSQRDCPELMKLARVWCESNFNQTLASRRLNIHKNTLCYRLSRFEKVTGIDLHDFNNAVAVYIALRSKTF
ncbi:MAG: helix-turn-helix domain-containing protein [Synergistaceae bacterium]|nr:helix-turn-helix domain-containing protein [Candidatus Equadaptatus faecalis]